MLEVQMHMGHQTNKWNPKMKPFIYGKRNNFHILDLIKSYYYTRNALRYMKVAASEGKSVLFIGTKKEAKHFIAEAALECNSFYINEKWVGGLLTNWYTFRKSTKKLLLLERQAKNGFLEKLPKKEMAKKLKEKDKLTRLFKGIKHMKVLPDLVVIVGQLEEMNAVNECNRLGLRTVTLLDTDCHPTLADFIIPANDDSPASIKLLLDSFASAIQEGQDFFDESQANLQKRQKSGKKAQTGRKGTQEPKGRKGSQGPTEHNRQTTPRVQRNKSSIQWKLQKEAIQRAQEALPAKKATPVPDLLDRPKWVPPKETANV
jgi:small subunit ribosomal protein S2